MIKKLRYLFTLMLLLVASVSWGQTYETVLTLDCATASSEGSADLYGDKNTVAMSQDAVTKFLLKAAGLTEGITAGETVTSVYWAKGSGGGNIPDACLKVGKASAAGSFSFTLSDAYDDISRVIVTCYGWKNTSTLSINSSTGQVTSTAQTETVFTFDISATKTLNFNVTNSAVCITNIELQKNTSSTPIVVAPTFSLASGSYVGAQEITISTETEGATIYYTTDGTDPTSESDEYESPITISETKTLKAIAIKEGMTNSPITSATYTIFSLKTISDARSQVTDTEVATKGVVTSYVGANAYIQDSGAAICVYGYNLPINVGDEITVIGTLKDFNGLLEITTPTIKVISQGNAVTPTVKTIAEINADYSGENALQGWLVKIVNATVSAIEDQNTTIAQGENTIVVRGISDVEYAVGDALTLTGNIGCFNAAQIANPTDVTVEKNTEPSITVSETTINVAAAGGEGTINVTCVSIDERDIMLLDASGATATYGWLTVSIDDNDIIAWNVEENTGEERTAYLQVYGLDSDGNEVLSDIVTITQAAYVAPVEGDKYELVTDVTTLAAGDELLIAYVDEDGAYAMGEQNTNNRKAVTVTINDDNTITSTEETCVITLEGENEAWYFNVGSGYLYAASSKNNYLKTEAAADDNAKASISIAEGVATIIFQGTNTRNLMCFNPNISNNNPLFSCYGSTPPNGSLPQIYRKVKATETVTITDAKYATYVAPFNCTIAGDVTVYKVTAIGESNVILDKVTGAIRAGAAVVVNGEAGEYAVTKAESASELTGNLLKAATENITDITGKYVLADGKNGVGFYPVISGTIAKGKGYLDVTDATAKDFYGFGGDETGIDDINVNVNENANNAIYSISGQRLQKLQRGINIVNGKKIVVK